MGATRPTGGSSQPPAADNNSQSPQVSISVVTPPPPVSLAAGGFDEAGRQLGDFPEDMNPPENFAMVCPYIYRSGMPKKRNFAYLQKLRLKSVVTLILEEYPAMNQRFLDQNGIKLFQFGVAGNKEPFADIPEDIMCQALLTLMDRRNHPVLIHCNKGKHRTGCL
ncbi:tyrosine-protein phosphatase siw14, partial [Coemansia spiralis]